MKEEEKEKAPPHPHAHGAADAAPPPRAQLGDEHGSASVYRVGALEKAIAGFAQRETEAVVNPTVGSSFVSLDEAYEFYNIYSWESGFGVRYGASSMDSHGTKCIQQFVCTCEGKPSKDSDSFRRCECKASILLLRSRDSGWRVCEHQVGHNHPLSKMCAQRSSWQSHSSIDKNTRGLIRQLRENNVPHIDDTDAKNPLSDDIQKTEETFARIKAKDPTFGYTGLQLDSNWRVRPLLWTSGQSLQYQYFGDVIIFDTTYRSDKSGTPFGLFVGVNNNFETILLGGVLMINEKTESYKWVLSQFFQLMGREHPKTILTDRCEAIEEAVLEVLPSTTHRWFKWNVLRRAKDYLGFHYTKTSSFRVGLHKILNDTLTDDEFERAWEMLLEEHGLENHPFLKEIYEVRHKWVKAYFSDTFCATLTSTQKSESAKHFLKQHGVPRDCSMELFAEQYEKLRSDQQPDYGFPEQSTTMDEIALRTNLPIEKHASEVYTRPVYEQFVQAIRESKPYVVEAVIPSLRYIARCPSSESRKKWSRVQYEVNVREDGEAFMCVCKQFEHTGMLCCHAVKVMIHLGVCEIPRLHVMPRWTAKPLQCQMHCRGEPRTDTCQQCRHSAMHDQFLDLARLACEDDRCYEIVMRGIGKLNRELAAAEAVPRRRSTKPASRKLRRKR
ncbi:hypothetical protein ACQJBY_000614 [Aegilops geniculata]